MQTYWMKFSNGDEGYCQGQSASDAVRIAEHLTGKSVDLGPHKWAPLKSDLVKTVPYPTPNMIWQFEHPVHGRTPAFCYGGSMCHGRTSCPKRHACTE